VSKNLIRAIINLCKGYTNKSLKTFCYDYKKKTPKIKQLQEKSMK